MARRRQARPGGLLRLRPSGPPGFEDGTLYPEAARWDASQGLYLLDWDEVRESEDPHGMTLGFSRSVFQHACLVCGWDEALAASAEAVPPPVA